MVGVVVEPDKHCRVFRQLNQKIVVSTNTINLQEQLLKKDIPMVSKLLEEQGLIKSGEFRVACLKGRANYLCLQRWSRMLKSTDLSLDEARILA